MDKITRQIAEYTAALTYDMVPAETIHGVKQRLVDTMGVALGGRDCDSARIGIRLGESAVPARYPGRILSVAGRTTGESAGFVNCAMIRYLDFNDAWPAWGHPSDCLGGLLAVAEAAGADGKRLITATIIAYEVSLRLGAGTRFRKLGWDQGLYAAVGTTAGIAHLFGLSIEQTAHAVAVATVANIPLRASRAGQLSHWKGAATAYSVRNGVFGALLAAEGLTGPDRPFEGRHGLFDQVTGPFELMKFSTDDGGFLTHKTRLKYWPVEYGSQIAIFAARELRQKMPLDKIASIDIGTYKANWQESGSEPEKWDPKTRETADHSLPYIFARALMDGAITVSSFDEAAYRDPATRPLMAKITVRGDDRMDALMPDTIAIIVKATSTSGEECVIELAHPRGHEKNPMNDDEINEKFHRLADGVLGPNQAKKVADAWWNIDRAATLTPALDLLVPG